MSAFVPLLIAAQLMTGSNADASRNSVAKSREVMDSFGRCVAQARPLEAKAFVMNSTGASIDRRFFSGSLSSLCLRGAGQMRFQPVAARGAMAEYLISKEYPGAPSVRTEGVSLVLVQPVPRSEITGPIDKLPAEVRTRLEAAATDRVIALGECLIKTDQPAARSLLLSKLNKPDEDNAVQALVSAIQACVPKGQTLRIDKSGIRTGIAVAYYRLARTTVGISR